MTLFLRLCRSLSLARSLPLRFVIAAANSSIHPSEKASAKCGLAFPKSPLRCAALRPRPEFPCSGYAK